ncbi:hypothetical protein STSP_54950 [Streptomyces jeddahensis]|uniref:Uncharacterized protein n=1 Tax=Streptomyces jeddahensis TaxID=1716141 RepID=A0A177HLR2_9ACTN|nr:hypothetical protein STSP_54950 [Streptomyces jeddahensis]
MRGGRLCGLGPGALVGCPGGGNGRRAARRRGLRSRRKRPRPRSPGGRLPGRPPGTSDRRRTLARQPGTVGRLPGLVVGRFARVGRFVSDAGHLGGTHRARCGGEAVLESVGRRGRARVPGGVVVQLPPPVVLVTGAPLPLLAHAPIVHRTGRTKTGHQENPATAPAQRSRRAAPPPTGEPPGGAGVTWVGVRLPHVVGPGHGLGDGIAVRVRQFGLQLDLARSPGRSRPGGIASPVERCGAPRRHPARSAL